MSMDLICTGLYRIVMPIFHSQQHNTFLARTMSGYMLHLHLNKAQDKHKIGLSMHL